MPAAISSSPYILFWEETPGSSRRALGVGNSGPPAVQYSATMSQIITVGRGDSSSTGLSGESDVVRYFRTHSKILHYQSWWELTRCVPGIRTFAACADSDSRLLYAGRFPRLLNRHIKHCALRIGEGCMRAGTSQYPNRKHELDRRVWRNNIADAAKPRAHTSFFCFMRITGMLQQPARGYTREPRTP